MACTTFYYLISHTARQIFVMIFFVASISIFSHEFKSAYTIDDMIRVQQEINAPDYLEAVLPYDLSHMLVLLSYNGTKQDLMPVYCRSVMKMYTNFAKQVMFFDADMVLQFLNRFSVTMTQIVTKNSVVPLVKKNESAHSNLLYDQLFGAFSVQYNAFKENPEQFLHNISADVAHGAIQNGEYMELQQSIIRFLEHVLAKLLFDPTDHQRSWSVVKQMASTLLELVEKNIIADVNALDDILVSLSSRYTYFLKMFSDTVTKEFLLQMQKEIVNTQVSLFAYDTNAVFGRKSQLEQTINECLVMHQS